MMLQLYTWPHVAVLLVLLKFVAIARSDTFAECNGVAERTFVASTNSCSRYIFCDGDNSYDGDCGEGDYFNEIYQTCDPQELVDCRIGDEVGPTTTTTPSTATMIVITTATTLAATTPSGGVMTGNLANSTTAINLTTFPANFTVTPPRTTTTNISSTPPTTNAIDTSTTSALVTHTGCPLLDNPRQIVLLPHTRSCSDFFVCYHGEAIPMHCSAMLHFNIRTGKCDYPENAKCRTDSLTPKEQCQSHTVDLYPHPSNCNYFYFCRNGFLMLQQCPFFFGWDTERRACVALNRAKCVGGQKRL